MTGESREITANTADFGASFDNLTLSLRVAAVAATTPTVTLTANDKGDTLAVTTGTAFTFKWAITGDNMSASNCVATPTNSWFPTTAGLTGTVTLKIDPAAVVTYKLICWPSTGTQAANGVSDQVVVTATNAVTTCTAPLTENRTQTCPTGQTGSITQTRTKGAVPSCTWGSWTNTTNTCKTASTATTTATATTSTASSSSSGSSSSVASTSAKTGPETPLAAGGLLSLVLGASYFIKRRLG
jgi:hypothetical protein